MDAFDLFDKPEQLREHIDTNYIQQLENYLNQDKKRNAIIDGREYQDIVAKIQDFCDIENKSDLVYQWYQEFLQSYFEREIIPQVDAEF